MKIKKAASIPLILHDPFFSIWSSADCLYDKDPVHWCGVRQKMRGSVNINGKRFVFLGDKEYHEVIPQTSIDVTATTTEYTLENDSLVLKVRFLSPLLPDDMLLISRPCTYVDFEVEKMEDATVSIDFEVSADLVRQTHDTVIGHDGDYSDFHYSFMGRAAQFPLGGSDDRVAIDWGYVYVAAEDSSTNIHFDKVNEKIHVGLQMNQKSKNGFVIAFDDLLSINYFGEWKKAYWTQKYSSILEAIRGAFADKDEVLRRTERFDKELEAQAVQVGGEEYAFLCNLSYRQTIAAHKLITDENGEFIFLSKENHSNGCIGTVDVSYPSVPLFLLYNIELLKGMLRPIFKFAACDVWEYDFAPHDVGRYPYAWGQVYAWKEKYGIPRSERLMWVSGESGVFPPFYTYPAGSDIYSIDFQMPVEECGNILIMMAAIAKAEDNVEFVKPHWETLKLWKNYLVKYGADPGEQLCTDDFAGRLAHNVNLSVKAIMGIEAYAELAEMMGEADEQIVFHQLAKEMAEDWEKRAFANDHYSLTFGDASSWSLKYNLVWDKIWGSELFSEEVYEKEMAYYIEKTEAYGTPLDSRSTYAKSDWILWCAALAKDKEQMRQLICPVANYLENTETRVPFSDWYYADSGKYSMFIARSVQGGIYMPLYFNGKH